jgi:MOSC domain-containing protein YiiM
MRVVSVNVGRPRQVPWRGRMVETGIFKEPVDGRVAVTRLGLAGDEQADRRVHGGSDDLPAIERLLAAHGLPADWRGWLADVRAASA